MAQSKRKRTTRIIVAAFVALATLTGCGGLVGPVPDQQQVALQFEGGVLIKQAQKFIRCVPGGTRGDKDFGGHTYTYPSDQRIVDFSNDEGDRPPIVVRSKDGVDLRVPGTLQYTLNTDCGAGDGEAESPIVEFHNALGRRYSASFDTGEPNSVPGGWREVQRLYIEAPLEASMDRAALQYNWRDLVFNPKIKAQWEKDVLEGNEEQDLLSLQGLVDRGTPGKATFFQNFQPLIGTPDPAGDAGKQAAEAIVQGQKAVAQAQAEEATALANKAKAEAEIAVARAEAESKRLEVAPFGDPAEYNRNLCIQTPECNPYPAPIYVPGLTAPAAR